MPEAYKEPRTFKGFEVWWHSVQMTAKMHLTIIFIIFFSQLLLTLLLLYFIHEEIFSLLIELLFSFQFSLFLKALKLLFSRFVMYYLLTTPLWLLYPIMLARFKLKAKGIMRDEFLRGSKLISEDELKKLVMNDIKKEFKNLKNLK
jgi:hypothetical protein